MKVLLELAKEPSKNDLLIFDGNKFTPISKDKLLELCSINKKEIEANKKELADFKKSVNGKLKEFHNVLQLLSKGGM